MKRLHKLSETEKIEQDDFTKIIKSKTELSDDEKRRILTDIKKGKKFGFESGYPSIDRPWLKYYTEEQRSFKIPNSTCYDVLYNHNKDHLDDIAIVYFGNKISYRKLFYNIEKTVKAFQKIGVKKGDIVSFFAIDTPEVIYSFYALNRLGAISNMIDPRSSVTALKKYFNEVKSKYVISLDVFRNMMLDALDDTKVKKVIEISPINSASFIVKIITLLKRASKLDD